MVSALGGGPGQTTYAENIGVMAMTRIYSIYVFIAAAVTAIILGFCPKFGALINSIPVPVMGGISILLFGLIVATSGRIIRDAGIDFTSPRPLIVFGATLVIGGGSAALQFAHSTVSSLVQANKLPADVLSQVPTGTINIGNFALGDMALATFAAILLNQLLLRLESQPQHGESIAVADAEV